MKASEVMWWQQRYRIEWDATDGRNGGAQRTVWEMLMEMERFQISSGRLRFGAVALVLLVLELVGLGDALQLPMEDILRVLCGYFEHQRRVQFKGCAADPLRTTTAILPGSKWSCLLLRIVSQDALSEVTKIYPSLKWRVFVDDITALLMGKKQRSG